VCWNSTRVEETLKKHYLSRDHIDARLWEQHDNTDKEVAQRRIKTNVCMYSHRKRKRASVYVWEETKVPTGGKNAAGQQIDLIYGEFEA
jgi:hypothetical protein